MSSDGKILNLNQNYADFCFKKMAFRKKDFFKLLLDLKLFQMKTS